MKIFKPTRFLSSGLLAVVVAILSSFAPRLAVANPIAGPLLDSLPGPTPSSPIDEAVPLPTMREWLQTNVKEGRLNPESAASVLAQLESSGLKLDGVYVIPDLANSFVIAAGAESDAPVIDPAFPSGAVDVRSAAAGSEARNRMLALSAFSLAAAAAILVGRRYLRRDRA